MHMYTLAKRCDRNHVAATHIHMNVVFSSESIPTVYLCMYNTAFGNDQIKRTTFWEMGVESSSFLTWQEIENSESCVLGSSPCPPHDGGGGGGGNIFFFPLGTKTWTTRSLQRNRVGRRPVVILIVYIGLV